MKTPDIGPDGPGIPAGGTSLSLPQGNAPQTKNDAGQRTDIGYTKATLDSVLFDDGLFAGPDLPDCLLHDLWLVSLAQLIHKPIGIHSLFICNVIIVGLENPA